VAEVQPGASLVDQLARSGKSYIRVDIVASADAGRIGASRIFPPVSSQAAAANLHRQLSQSGRGGGALSPRAVIIFLFRFGISACSKFASQAWAGNQRSAAIAEPHLRALHEPHRRRPCILSSPPRKTSVILSRIKWGKAVQALCAICTRKIGNASPVYCNRSGQGWPCQPCLTPSFRNRRSSPATRFQPLTDVRRLVHNRRTLDYAGD